MKHSGSRDFFAYWDRQRGDAPAPDRRSIEPEAVRHVLADSFVLAYDAARGCPLRAAGTRLCALFGRDLVDTSFVALWDDKSRDQIAELLSIVTLECQPAVAGASAVNEAGFLHLELLLLPFAIQPYTPRRLTGLLAPLTQVRPGDIVQRGLALTSWRHLEPDRAASARQPRRLVRRNPWPGVTLYEGDDHNA